MFLDQADYLSQLGPKTLGQVKVRLACRDAFRQSKLLERLIPAIEDILGAGGLAVPEAAPEAAGPAIPNPEPSGDAGHRG